jgi:hypothetical protein
MLRMGLESPASRGESLAAIGPDRNGTRPAAGAAVTRPSCGRPVHAVKRRPVFRWTTDDTKTRLVGPCPRRRPPVREAPSYLDSYTEMAASVGSALEKKLGWPARRQGKSGVLWGTEGPPAPQGLAHGGQRALLDVEDHQEKGCPEALRHSCRAGREPGAVPQAQTDLGHGHGSAADGAPAPPLYGARRGVRPGSWPGRDPLHGRYSRSDYSARVRAACLRRRHQTPKPTGTAIAARTSEEGSGTPLIKRELIAKSPETAGGSSIPKTIEVISAFVSETPMKIAEPSSSAVESPFSVNVPRLFVPEKAVMVAVKGPALSS